MNRNSPFPRLLRLRTGAAALLALTVALPAGSETAANPGFAISVDGKPVAGDARMARKYPRRAPASVFPDVLVAADGLGVRPRLSVEVLEAGSAFATVQSRMNYPAYVSGSEVRLVLYSPGAAPRIVSRAELPVNGRARLALPDLAPGESLAVIHRVSDAAGRFDETRPVSLQARGIAEAEEGRDEAALRNIPVAGGAVTVSGRNLAPGQSVSVLGEVIAADPSGAFVLQRILPVGDHAVPVSIGGRSLPAQVVTIPQSEWFGTGIADFTFGRTLSGPDAGRDWNRGRLAYYVNGKTASGVEITSSADTGTAPIADLFRDFDRKDPQGLIARMAPDLAYPTYGDDALLENGAPTDGRFYLKVKRDGSHLVWGNYQSRLGGAHYLRNDRKLYGLQAHYVTPATTSRGDARGTVTLQAALPGQLPGQDVFLGTGGSVYFLSKQDLALGSETVTVETIDPVTGRVIDRRVLVAGRDYAINYLQGSVMLTAPLSGTSGGTGGVISTAPGDQPQTRLVVQYGYTPLAGDVKGYVLGGRAEAWLNDDIRLGVTGMKDQTGTADQTASGVDLLFRFGENSQITADVARSEGPGFAYTTSPDGGLTVTGIGAAGSGTGTAARIAGDIDLADLGIAGKGRIGFWHEDRRAGFTTQDRRITDDEKDSGIKAEFSPHEGLTYRFNLEDYSSASGALRRKAGAEVAWKPEGSRVEWALALAQEDRVDPAQPTKTGARSDAALKATVRQSDDLSWYVFGQTTLSATGGRSRNDRVGAGVIYSFGENWKAEAELSGGSYGPGARALLRRDEAGRRLWIGYVLDPGRELSGVTLNGSDQGRLTAGAEVKVSDDVTLTGENSYDIFGTHRALTSRYGVEYRYSDALSLTTSIDIGRVDDPVMGDFDRTALSFGLRHASENGLNARARVELRQDQGTQGGSPVDTRTYAFSGDAEWKLSEDARLLGSLNATRTLGTSPSLPEASYVKATFGYAYRPVETDRLNFLLRYTFLHDLYGQRLNGTLNRGPRQRSHVLSADLTYDLNERWVLGAKAGLRLSETAASDTAPFVANDASLLVLNARYHLTHKWDLLIEARQLRGIQSGLTETGFLGSVSRQIGDNLMLGVGYNSGSFSDDLTDMVRDDNGLFLSITGKF